jgi:hypothetical protein
MIDVQAWGVCQQALIEESCKNHIFVGSYKLPLSQYMCTGLVVACSFQQDWPLTKILLSTTQFSLFEQWMMNATTGFL